MTAKRIGLALVEDNARFRERLVQRLEFFPDVEVLFTAGSAEEFFERLPEARRAPEVVLMDIGLPGASGIEAVHRLAELDDGPGCLMLTVFEEPDKVFAAIRAGAAGYLLKEAPAEELVAAIREVRAGGVPLSRPVARQVLRMVAQGPEASSRVAADAEASSIEALSKREGELLEQIVRGDTEAQIAERLCISPHTVRTHVKNIYRKLRVRSRAAAVRVAYERRLLD